MLIIYLRAWIGDASTGSKTYPKKKKQFTVNKLTVRFSKLGFFFLVIIKKKKRKVAVKPMTLLDSEDTLN
jgi:hypothetical protein